MNVILFEIVRENYYYNYFAGEKDKNIIIDGFVYTVINFHINLSLVYEKMTYQVININFRKAQTLEITNQ